MRTPIQMRITTVTDDCISAPLNPEGKRQTLTFNCADMDEAFDLIRAYKPQNFWAQIICLTPGKVELHLRPLEEKDY